MATLEELKVEMNVKYSMVNEVQWTSMITEEGVDRFTIEQLEVLINNYVSDITQSRQQLRVEGLSTTIVPCNSDGTKKTQNILIAAMHDFFDQADAMIASEDRLFQSFAVCVKQKERLEA